MVGAWGGSGEEGVGFTTELASEATLLAVALVVSVVLLFCSLGGGSPTSQAVRRRRSKGGFARDDQGTQVAAGRFERSQQQPLLQSARVRRRGAGFW